MSKPMKYRKKPVEIEAMRWNGTAQGAIPIIDWILQTGSRDARWDNNPKHLTGPDGFTTTITDRIEIDTLEGTMIASPGDWIIRGVSNEYYPCKPDIFNATYEAVADHD